MPLPSPVTPRALPAALLLLALLTACSDPADPASGDAPARKWDLRPRWSIGQACTVREELRHFKGSGPFPGAAQIESRATSVDRSVDIYDITVVWAEGSRLATTDRTYRNSVHTVDGELQPTVVSGRRYRIEAPLGAIAILRIAEDGAKRKPLAEEKVHVARFGLRLAASLIPGEPVPLGATWKPGRSLEALAIRGGTGTRMVARLDRIEEGEDARIAVVTAETDSRILVQRGVESNLSIRETLRIDLDRGRFDTYRSVTDWQYPAFMGKPEMWRRSVLTVTVTGE